MVVVVVVVVLESDGGGGVVAETGTWRFWEEGFRRLVGEHSIIVLIRVRLLGGRIIKSAIRTDILYRATYR